MTVDRTLHKYTLGEELISAISHGIGAILALIGTILLGLKAADNGTLPLISVIIYGISMTVMYTCSTVYHSLAPNNGKKVMRILDHCFIYALIIGTYAPFTLAGIQGWMGITIFSVVLILGIIGITLTAIDMKKYTKFCFICYLAMGWTIIIAIKPLITALNSKGLLFLILGGIIYTIGAVLYGIGKKYKYIHSLWHFFVLGGSIFLYLSIYFNVIR